MDTETYYLGPDHWTLADLDRPSAECIMPPAVRPEGDAGIYVRHTCEHCNVTFLLVTSMTEEFWANFEQHRLMVDSQHQDHYQDYYHTEEYSSARHYPFYRQYSGDWETRWLDRDEETSYTEITNEEENGT